MYLNALRGDGGRGDSLCGPVDENPVGEDHRQPLEEHGAGADVVQVLHPQHVAVKVLSHVGQTPLEPGEQRRVVQRPHRRVLQGQRDTLAGWAW